ncbi:MAG: (Fe-S)-binding protein [Porticoccaceae bacterium]|nr:(Fe-S)-binding protein [Porticoccaceae bacterium]
MTTPQDTPEHPFLTNFLKDLYHCSDCGYCVDAIWEERDIHHICATLQSHSPGLSYSGQGYLKTARAWVEGEDLPLSSVAEHAFTCVTCGNCERICPIGMRPMEINRALRSELIMRDMAPDTVVQIQESVLQLQNPSGGAVAERYDWATGQTSVDANTAKPSDILYLPGCASAYSRPQEAQATLRLLAASGQSIQLLGDDDRCCGAPLKELGFVDDANNNARQLSDSLAQRSYSTLLTSGCECANSLAESPGHSSFVTWLTTALDAQRLNFSAKNALPHVACIESCQATMNAQLQSACGNDNQALYELLTQLGVTVNGGESASRYALCCGAAGGAPAMHPTSSADMARARINEALAEAESDGGKPLAAIVSIDPRCVSHLDSAREASDPPIYGLAEFLDTFFTVNAEDV